MASSQRLVGISHCCKTANEVWGGTEADKAAVLGFRVCAGVPITAPLSQEHQDC